eukprot:753551-Hanusia_phi.AAC.3
MQLLWWCRRSGIHDYSWRSHRSPRSVLTLCSWACHSSAHISLTFLHLALHYAVATVTMAFSQTAQPYHTLLSLHAQDLMSLLEPFILLPSCQFPIIGSWNAES